MDDGVLCVYNITRELTDEEETQRKFSQLVNGYLSVACVLIGTVFNLYGVRSVHVTNFDKNRGVVLAVSVLALAFWDTVLLWCAFFYYAVKKLPISDRHSTLNAITPSFHAFSQIANTASVWCMVAITAQRYMATRDPFRCSRSTALLQSFRERRQSSISFLTCYANRRLLRMPLLISMFAILVNLPAFFEVTAVYCYRLYEKQRVYMYELRITALRQDPRYKFVYKLLTRMLITTIGPNILIMILTVMTIFILRGSNRSRRQLFRLSDSLLDRYSSRETMQTMVSIMLVTKFLLFRSLAFVLDIIEILFFRTELSIFIYMVDISNFFVLLNSATNCILFLKASSWLNEKINERKTMKRKRTVTETGGQMARDRVTILCSSWENALKITNNQLGLNILYAMVRRQPSLMDSFRPAGETAIAALIGLPCKRSFDLMAHSKYNEIAGRITAFIEEVLDMMKNGIPEQCIVLRIRRVGAIHHSRNIKLSSSVWKEFKACIISVIGECEYATQLEHDSAIEAWGTFISFIIREMKMGVWAIDS